MTMNSFMLKQAWIEDLLTHPELQGKQFLDRDGRFCCLGRLQVIAHVERAPYTTSSYNERARGCYSYNGRAADLNDSDRLKYGISVQEMNHLIDMNDEGKTFRTIAYWIRKNL